MVKKKKQGGQGQDNVTRLPSAGNSEILRILEAILFAAVEPLDMKSLQTFTGEDNPLELHASLNELQQLYAGRGVNLVEIGGRWSFRTAEDLSGYLEHREQVQKKLSPAALETLAIIAYHQPVTRAEIEEIRGVSTSRGTLDILLETGWVKPKGRRAALGRPVIFGTTQDFLEHFGLASLGDLPGVEELREAGLVGNVQAFEAALQYGVGDLPDGADTENQKDEEE